MQYSFSKFFSMQVSSVILSSRGEEKKKESGDSSVNGYWQPLLTHLPTAVSLLLF
jgi:hypothetical protein